jgi:hypothetical protein
LYGESLLSNMTRTRTLLSSHTHVFGALFLLSLN